VPSLTSKHQQRYRFRAFYITVLFISLFAVISVIADRAGRYRLGVQYGAAQRRALEELDITRLVKRDEEVRKTNRIHRLPKGYLIKISY